MGAGAGTPMEWSGPAGPHPQPLRPAPCPALSHCRPEPGAPEGPLRSWGVKRCGPGVDTARAGWASAAWHPLTLRPCRAGRRVNEAISSPGQGQAGRRGSGGGPTSTSLLGAADPAQSRGQGGWGGAGPRGQRQPSARVSPGSPSVRDSQRPRPRQQGAQARAQTQTGGCMLTGRPGHQRPRTS